MEVPTNAIGFRVGAGSMGDVRVGDVEDGCNLDCGFGLPLGPGFIGETGTSGRYTQSMTAVPSSTRLKINETAP